MPEVSVIIPTYNCAGLIRETLDSVLTQTYKDFEIVIVNDGSTDNTLDALSLYGDRIRVISQTNQGRSAARNTGIREAKGDYLAFLDSDDLWLPNKLESQMALLKTTPDLLWVYSDAEVFDSKTNKKLYLHSQLAPLYEGDILAPLFLENFIPSATPVLSREIFYGIGEYCISTNIGFPEDWHMWLRVASRYKIGLVSKPLARYRVHDAMNTLSQSWEMIYNGRIAVVESAIALSPHKLGPLKNRALANIAIGSARKCAGNGDLVMARKMLKRAIKLAPETRSAYVYWLGCLVGQPWLNIVIGLRRYLRSKI